MSGTTYRAASAADVTAMAELRATSGWTGGAGAETMARYLAGEHHSQHALAPRTAFVAETAGEMVGFAAGHLTTRFGCAGELQWLLVAPASRGRDVGSGLLSVLAGWFADHDAARVCVNVAPDNEAARRLYSRHGAIPLNEFWMVWNDVAAAVRPDAAVTRDSVR